MNSNRFWGNVDDMSFLAHSDRANNVNNNNNNKTNAENEGNISGGIHGMNGNSGNGIHMNIGRNAQQSRAHAQQSNPTSSQNSHNLQASYAWNSNASSRRNFVGSHSNSSDSSHNPHSLHSNRPFGGPSGPSGHSTQFGQFGQFGAQSGHSGQTPIAGEQSQHAQHSRHALQSSRTRMTSNHANHSNQSTLPSYVLDRYHVNVDTSAMSQNNRQFYKNVAQEADKYSIRNASLSKAQIDAMKAVSGADVLLRADGSYGIGKCASAVVNLGNIPPNVLILPLLKPYINDKGVLETHAAYEFGVHLPLFIFATVVLHHAHYSEVVQVPQQPQQNQQPQQPQQTQRTRTRMAGMYVAELGDILVSMYGEDLRSEVHLDALGSIAACDQRMRFNKQLQLELVWTQIKKNEDLGRDLIKKQKNCLKAVDSSSFALYYKKEAFVRIVRDLSSVCGALKGFVSLDDVVRDIEAQKGIKNVLKIRFLGAMVGFLPQCSYMRSRSDGKIFVSLQQLGALYYSHDIDWIRWRAHDNSSQMTQQTQLTQQNNGMNAVSLNNLQLRELERKEHLAKTIVWHELLQQFGVKRSELIIAHNFGRTSFAAPKNLKAAETRILDRNSVFTVAEDEALICAEIPGVSKEGAKDTHWLFRLFNKDNEDAAEIINSDIHQNLALLDLLRTRACIRVSSNSSLDSGANELFEIKVFCTIKASDALVGRFYRNEGVLSAITKKLEKVLKNQWDTWQPQYRAIASAEEKLDAPSDQEVEMNGMNEMDEMDQFVGFNQVEEYTNDFGGFGSFGSFASFGSFGAFDGLNGGNAESGQNGMHDLNSVKSVNNMNGIGGMAGFANTSNNSNNSNSANSANSSNNGRSSNLNYGSERCGGWKRPNFKPHYA